MQVQTVLGPVDACELGVTLVHEHLQIDMRCWFEQPRAADRQFLIDEKVSPALRGVLNSDPYHCRDNLIIDDVYQVITELNEFVRLGGGTVIDVSSRSLGPHPHELATIARATGLHIVASTGFYVQRAHPSWVADATVSSLYEFMLAEACTGINGTGIKAGIIGELGTSSPMVPDEQKVFEAGAKVQSETGLAINVHLPIFSREGHNALNVLEKAGANLERVVLSHLDESLDFGYIDSLARRGVFIELDTFGSDCSYDQSDAHEPCDWERIELLIRLLEAGHAQQILLSHDICTKMQLMQNAGYGFGHILRTIVPRLQSRGITPTMIDAMLIDNPARMLSAETTIRRKDQAAPVGERVQ